MKTVEVFGLERSGTHYLRWILQNCFSGIRLPKHTPLHRAPSELHYTPKEAILIYKDYDHWYDSYRRFPYAKDLSDDFLEQRYEKFISEWKALIPAVRYEDFLIDYVRMVKYVGVIINQQPVSYKTPGKLPWSPSWKESDRNRYVDN